MSSKKGEYGIVTNVKEKMGFIWSPNYDVVFIPPLLLSPGLQVGMWVLFNAEYYIDKHGERRVRVTSYEAVENRLPTRIKGKDLMVWLCSHVFELSCFVRKIEHVSTSVHFKD
jgi:hypothetical protein